MPVQGDHHFDDGGDIDMAYHAKEYRVSKENEVEEQETYFEGAVSSAGNPVTLTMNILIKGVTQGNQTQKFYEDGSTGGVLE